MGFIYNMEDENLVLSGNLRHIIKCLKWDKFCRHPNPYNMQIVNEFYSDLVDTSHRRMEVVVRGTKVVYYEATINVELRLRNVADKYQNLLETMDDQTLMS